jgi:hypothetical protein
MMRQQSRLSYCKKQREKLCVCFDQATDLWCLVARTLPGPKDVHRTRNAKMLSYANTMGRLDVCSIEIPVRHIMLQICRIEDRIGPSPLRQGSGRGGEGGRTGRTRPVARRSGPHTSPGERKGRGSAALQDGGGPSCHGHLGRDGPLGLKLGLVLLERLLLAALEVRARVVLRQPVLWDG